MKSIKKYSLLGLALAIASLGFSGCVTNSSEDKSDGQSAFLVSETDQIGSVPSTLPAGAAANPIPGETIIQPAQYDSSCQCFVRKADFTGCKGFERERSDSLWLYDAAGLPMDHFDINATATILHKRHVIKLGPKARDVDIQINISVQIMDEGGVKVGTWNGTVTGSFNGESLESGSIIGVKRVFADGKFQFPESGSMEVVRKVHTFHAEFLGGGVVQVTITNRKNGKVHVVTVDRDYNETEK